MKKTIIATLFLSTFSLASHAGSFRYAIDYSKAIENSRNEGGAQGVEVSAAWHPDVAFNQSGRFSFYIDSQLSVFESDARRDKGDKAMILSVSPMLRLELFQIDGRRVFAEAGIGASYLSEDVFADQLYSTHFQFRDRLALSVELDQAGVHQLSLKRTHYSNADIDEPNPGFDTWSLSYSRAF